jgi:hypothetical protein
MPFPFSGITGAQLPKYFHGSMIADFEGWPVHNMNKVIFHFWAFQNRADLKKRSIHGSILSYCRFVRVSF